MKIAAILIFCGISHAQIPETQKTLGQLNCRFWNGLDESARTHFLIGIGEAWNVFVEGSDLEKKYPFPYGTYGEIKKGVTDVCVRPENSAITVWIAIRAFHNLLSGETRESVEQMLTLARKAFSNSTAPANK